MKFRLVESDNLKDKDINLNDLPDESVEEVKDMIDKLEAMIDFDVEVGTSKLLKELDDSLEAALGDIAMGDMPKGYDILVIGRAGIGKTAQIEQWAKARHVNLVSKDAKTLDKSDIGGGVAAEFDDEGKRLNQMTHLYNSEFESLDEPGTVLFLDELNRADTETIGSLLTLIRDHKIPKNGEKGAMREFNNLLFSVAAINPPEYYDGVNEFDMATLNRFKNVNTGVDIDTKDYEGYAIKQFKRKFEEAQRIAAQKPDSRTSKKLVKAAEGRLKLLQTILKSPYFEWDSIETEQRQLAQQKPCLVPRTLSSALKNCDGTKESFLQKAELACGEPSQQMFEDVLAQYVDVEDKANDALKFASTLEDQSEESLFGKESAWDKLSDLF